MYILTQCPFPRTERLPEPQCLKKLQMKLKGANVVRSQTLHFGKFPGLGNRHGRARGQKGGLGGTLNAPQWPPSCSAAILTFIRAEWISRFRITKMKRPKAVLSIPRISGLTTGLELVIIPGNKKGFIYLFIITGILVIYNFLRLPSNLLSII